ncbi:hypothetical protein EDD35_0397 [Amycolatopsis thermoflava]|uniref:Uncharacterized protein n=1 Tax=Amycolatopsis thermoflava TaxID=84480 RepID=A0A3N2GNZ9_9PSEU|nr:hypothetical protein EDD35_0397 [Amycolatopsis thermoflava]
MVRTRSVSRRRCRCRKARRVPVPTAAGSGRRPSRRPRFVSERPSAWPAWCGWCSPWGRCRRARGAMARTPSVSHCRCRCRKARRVLMPTAVGSGRRPSCATPCRPRFVSERPSAWPAWCGWCSPWGRCRRARGARVRARSVSRRRCRCRRACRVPVRTMVGSGRRPSRRPRFVSERPSARSAWCGWCSPWGRCRRARGAMARTPSVSRRRCRCRKARRVPVRTMVGSGRRPGCATPCRPRFVSERPSARSAWCGWCSPWGRCRRARGAMARTPSVSHCRCRCRKARRVLMPTAVGSGRRPSCATPCRPRFVSERPSAWPAWCGWCSPWGRCRRAGGARVRTRSVSRCRCRCRRACPVPVPTMAGAGRRPGCATSCRPRFVSERPSARPAWCGWCSPWGRCRRARGAMARTRSVSRCRCRCRKARRVPVRTAVGSGSRPPCAPQYISDRPSVRPSCGSCLVIGSSSPARARGSARPRARTAP